MVRRRNSAAVMAGIAVLAACGQPQSPPPPPPPSINVGLSTSLPVYWPESDDLSELLAQEVPVPWPRQAIEQRHRLVPLDSLADAAALRGVDAVLMAQPRPLTAAENVGIDQWVREGGQVLLFADPVLTQESEFHVGDRRRPQDVALLSPILSRWGLALEFDEAQPAGERMIDDPVAGPIPVNLPGRLRKVAGASQPGDRCDVGPQGLVARCTIGRGRVTVVADAALFEPADDLAERERALLALIDSLARDGAGRTGDGTGTGPKTGQPPPGGGGQTGEEPRG